MAKGYDEITAEIVQELMKARSQIIAGIDSSRLKKDYLDEYLSNEAAVNDYKAIYQAVTKPLDN